MDKKYPLFYLQESTGIRSDLRGVVGIVHASSIVGRGSSLTFSPFNGGVWLLHIVY